MIAKRIALITGSCLASGLVGCAGNSPLNPESLLSQFNPPKPEEVAVWPLLEEIDNGTPTQNIRDAFDLRADAKITIWWATKEIDPKDFKKLERSKDCAYVEAAYEDTILTCRKKPAEALAEFVERENADEHIFQTKHVFVSWADGVGYRYALRDFPKLPAVLNSSKCAPDEYGLRYTCRINAPKAYRQKMERNPNAMIPSSLLRLRPDLAWEAE